MPNPGQIAANDTPGDELDAYARSFARHLRAANLSPMTVKSYIDGVEQLRAYLRASGNAKPVRQARRA